MKFDEEFNGRFKDRIETLERVTALTNTLGRQLSKVHKHGEFIETAIQFAKIAVDTPSAIMDLVVKGNIAHAQLLLRWLLEHSHLLWYLGNNEAQYAKWKAGKKVHPEDVGRFFADSGMPTWESPYDEWSNVVHGNSIFVNNYWTIARRTPKSEGQCVLVGNAIVNALFLTMQINYFLTDTLKPYLSTDELGDIGSTTKLLEKELKAHWDSQLSNERKLMDE